MSIFNMFKKKSPGMSKYMSITEAGNWIKEKFTKGIREQVKKDTKDFQPTIAPERDRDRFLRYGVGLLKYASPRTMRALPRGLIMANGLSSKEVAKLIRTLLHLRLSGCSPEGLSDFFHVPTKTVLDLEKIAIEAVKEAIQQAQKNAVPIIGG